MKMYKRVSRFSYLRGLSMAERRFLAVGAKLKPGDLVHTCSGYNKVVKEVKPERWDAGRRRKRGWVIMDFDILTTDGYSCSWRNCCTWPLPTKAHIVEWFKGWDYEKHRAAMEVCNIRGFVAAILRGEDVFNEDGTLNEHGKELEIADRKFSYEEKGPAPLTEAIKRGEEVMDEGGALNAHGRALIEESLKVRE